VLKPSVICCVQGMKSADASADAVAEISMLHSERNALRLRIRTLQETVDSMTARNAQLLADLQASNIVDTAGGLTCQLYDEPEVIVFLCCDVCLLSSLW